MLTAMVETRVYRNLHRKCYSLQQRVTGKGWRVQGHRSGVYLSDATFEVSESGRQRVLATKKKNVHAFVRGRYCGPTFGEPEVLQELGASRLSYNPYRGGHFVDMNTGLPVAGAQSVWLTISGVYAKGLVYAPLS